jgi:lipid-A-disaccharide synthase
MAKNIDRLISIFPFEAQHFKGTGLSVDYVGHPLVDEARAVHSDADFGSLPWKGEPRIALLPGSRRQEVQRILPVMLDAVDGFGESHPDASFIVAAPSPEIEACINDTIKGHRASSIVKVSVATGSTRAVLKQAHAAVVTSGTATLEASLMRCPMIVVYRMAPLTYCFGKILVRVDHIGMVNLVAGSRLCPELIQGEANGRRIAAELEPIVSDPETRERMLAGLDEVNAGLGDGGAATRAADSVISALQV